jgi:hypothetical protein
LMRGDRSAAIDTTAVVKYRTDGGGLVPPLFV